MYPNPVRDKLNIDHMGEPALAEIISLSGNTIRTFRVESGQNHVDIGQLRKGMYVLRISGNGTMESHPIIRQ